MPIVRNMGWVLGATVRAARLLVRAVLRTLRWAVRRMAGWRARGAGGEAGMIRLFDLHAASCAGDTLITIGLAGTIFFSVPLGEARSKVALYLLITMAPFALLAPVIGPLLDHFRHGRRYALAATMLGRAFLVWLISDYIHGFGLYPAAFGALALSRAYGVARSAAVPRLLPPGLGLSEAGARASVYGTVAGAAAAPIGVLTFQIGPQWPLRVAAVIFVIGMVTSLRLPPRADADPPETVPQPITSLFGLRRRSGERALSGPLVVAALIGSATLRALYGFLLLFLAFAVKAGDLNTALPGRTLNDEAALGLIGAALGVGTFLATAVGTRLRIHRPVAVQSGGLIVVAGTGVLATLFPSLLMVSVLCVLTATASGLAKLAVDATIQERIGERLRASAFAHSETALMLAFVAGGALGLIPFGARAGIGVAAAFAVLAAVRAVLVAGRLRRERLYGHQGEPAADPAATAPGAAPVAAEPARPAIRNAPPAGPVPQQEPSRPGPPRPFPPAADETLAPPGYHIYRPSGMDHVDTQEAIDEPSPPGDSPPEARPRRRRLR